MEEPQSIRSQVHFQGTARLPTGELCRSFQPNKFSKEKCRECSCHILQHTSSAVSDTEISIVIELEQSKHPGNLIIPATIDLAAPPRSGCLWLGGYQACREPFLKARGITVVLNTARALEKFYPAWGKEVARMEGAGLIQMRRVLWVDDTAQIIPVAEFVELCRWLHGELQRANVLVHCAQGKSRSTTVVLAYVMVTRNLAPEEALVKVVRPARQLAEPNPGFLRRLQAFHTSDEFAKLREELSTGARPQLASAP